MSTIKSSDEHLTLNADGSSKDIKFQANGVEKASIDSSGNLTVSGNLTSTGIDDNADATAITITSAERIGINHTTPEARLEIDGGSETGLMVRSTVAAEYPAIFQSASTGSVPITDFRNNGGTSQLKVMSDGRGLSQFTAKAWINMNGTGTIAIRDSHNVSSISDVSTGNYTINLSNTLANTDFSAVSDASNTASYNFFDSWENYSFRTTSRTQIRCYSADTYRDANSVSVVIFGD